jgi:hypothetical protein
LSREMLLQLALRCRWSGQRYQSGRRARFESPSTASFLMTWGNAFVLTYVESRRRIARSKYLLSSISNHLFIIRVAPGRWSNLLCWNLRVFITIIDRTWTREVTDLKIYLLSWSSLFIMLFKLQVTFIGFI